jgi:hypothetical protein
MHHATPLLKAISIAILLSSPAAAVYAQQSTCGVMPAGSCLTPTTPSFNSAPPPPALPGPGEVPVSPINPLPGSTAVGGTVNPNSGLSQGCTGQVFSATGC